MDECAIKKYKQILCQTMKAFIRFCDDNDIKYMACGGTAIGALRHKGIIPWDDDIDVYMFRRDYERFISLRRKLESTSYRVGTPGDANYYYSFSKFFDATTTLVELPQFDKCVIGVYIDIFPLDEVEGPISEIKKLKHRYDYFYMKYQYSYWKVTPRSICAHLYHGMFKHLFYLIYTKLLTNKQLYSLRDEFVQFDKKLINNHGTKVLTFISIYGLEKEIFEKKWFADTLEVDFEDFKIKIPAEYDRYLTHLYGDYMTPPPPQKQVTRHYHYYLNLKERLDYTEIKNRLKKGEHTVI